VGAFGQPPLSRWGDQPAIERCRSASVNAVSNDVEATPQPADLDAIGGDLAGVESALRRLDDGSYWTDEVTGAALSDELLAVNPVARRAT
jgi:RNA polymerase-binding transcription factor DksA